MIRVENVTLSYGERVLLEGADAEFRAGEFIALMGRNGAGKSTLLRAVARLAPPAAGKIFLAGMDAGVLKPREIARYVALVSTDEVRVANLRVADVVALGRAPHTGWRGRLSASDRAVAGRALELTGLSEYAPRSIDTLSDGERQRVMIARALAQQTPIILLDEPTAYLDLPNRYEIFSLLALLARDENKTILCSTHDLRIAAGACSTMALLDSGTLLHGPMADILPRVEKILLPPTCT